MNKKKYLLLIISIFPTIVLANNNNTDVLPLTMALGMEAFITIHMTIFVLKPLSKMLDSDGTQKTFWPLFIGRIIFLLIFDFFITTGIAFIDFFILFIGAFLISLLENMQNNPLIYRNPNNIPSALDQNTTTPQNNVILKCTKCGGILQPTDKVCSGCGAAFEGDNVQVIQDTSPIVQLNQKYIANEKNILKDIIIEEIKNKGENEKTLSTPNLNLKKNILLGITGILTLICVIMFYFNYSIFLCLTINILVIIISNAISKKFNIINMITKKATKNPTENISDIINNAINEKQEITISHTTKLVIIILIMIIIPTSIFTKPKILYQKINDEYYVLRYTRGLTFQKEITIPDTYKGKKVTGIQENAFKNSNIEKITLPQTLTTIKTKAFYNCKNIQEITIPSTVTEIRASAFENDEKLITVNLTNGLINIRGSAFKNCKNLQNIVLPDTLEYLGASAFSHCSSLKEITIPKKVIEINGQTFEYCTSLQKVYMHNDIISIHGENFIGDINLEEITLPSKITEIRGNTFEGCTKLKEIDIPEGVTRIGGHAFYGCTNLSKVNIPSTLLEIGSSAFRMCTSLNSITLPRGVVINERAFKESPTKIYYDDENIANQTTQQNKENKQNITLYLNEPQKINENLQITLTSLIDKYKDINTFIGLSGILKIETNKDTYYYNFNTDVDSNGEQHYKYQFENYKLEIKTGMNNYITIQIN